MTATGKSSLAVTLAKKINGEIISADSRQVYRGYNIATAKITPKETDGVKHYLIDILDPNEEFSAGIFVNLAKTCISEIAQKGKIPIIIGGTGLYLKMLLDGIDMPKSKPDYELRNELENILKKQGTVALYNMLCLLDAEFAATIHPNDTYKIMRSIEILKHSNTSMSKARGYKNKEYDVLKIALGALDREVIYRRINQRVDLMFQLGLEAEARSFYDSNPNLKSFLSTIGYQEFVPYFKGECRIEEVVEKIKRNTRRYAKRQLTWFKAQKDIHWFNIDELSPEIIELKVLELCNQFIF